MKTQITGLLKSGGTRWVMLTGLLIASGLSLAWMQTGQYRLGGAFMGSGGGLIWNAIQVPLDPAGRTAALRVTPVSYGPDIAGLLAAFGADTMTELVSEEEMTSLDTAKFASVGYGLKAGNPPGVCIIFVMRGTIQFKGANKFDVSYTTDVYPGAANELGLQNADTDGDGLPDTGVAPLYSIPGSGSAKRLSPFAMVPSVAN